ncbi:alpha/beta hydrolase [Limnoglobus roseus]|uniref:alpha/beta hydrolase n=1 Tax=Limnoglobus roseus TaxID=2598579 RepID=UPI0011EB633C|nr:alpha/beta fold hydrolase [Limnoglobus roseus]
MFFLLLIAAFGFANYLGYRHGYAFTHYAPAGDRPPKPESLSFGQKLRLGLTGVSVPRPVNARTPESVGLPFTVVSIPVRHEQLEAWHVPHPTAKGVVVMGPGYMSAKDSLLPEVQALHDLNFAVLLIDFRGAGGSPRGDVTLGVREGGDMAMALAFAKEEWPDLPIFAYGFSMGAVAVLKAVAVYHAEPTAIILDAPFDRMISVVRNRLRTMNVPAWPAAELVVFWGGRSVGIDGFAHNPADDARAVTCPTLILHGTQDARATGPMVQAVFENLPGPKQQVDFDGAGHEPLARFDREKWKQAVQEFLNR